MFNNRNIEFSHLPKKLDQNSKSLGLGLLCHHFFVVEIFRPAFFGSEFDYVELSFDAFLSGRNLAKSLEETTYLLINMR